MSKDTTANTPPRELNMFSTERLSKFLVTAKIAGYATEGEGGEQNRRDMSKELAYEDEDFKYLDRYYGFTPFSGIEVVWYQGKPVWSMTYYGTMLLPSVNPIDVYLFLKDAMKQISVERPFRGPASFTQGDFDYHDQSEGTVHRFSGIERIFHRRNEAFLLKYHGGDIRFSS